MPRRGSDAVPHGRPTSLVAFFLVLQRSIPCRAALGSDRRGVRGVAAQQSSANAGAQVYYVSDVSDRFAGFVAAHKAAAQQFYSSEQDRLEAAIRDATSQHDKALLEDTVVGNEEARLELQSAFNQMETFVMTLKQAMGAQVGAASCQFLECGAHAFCEAAAEGGARCRCQEGYEGNGYVCNPPTRLSERPLFQLSPGVPRPQVADLRVSTLRGNLVALVYRDVSKSNRGYVMFGKAERTGVNWSMPLLFSNRSEAFGPALVELQDTPGIGIGIAIAYRDMDRGGSGILLGARYDPKQNLLSVAPPRAFARHQAQRLALVSLPQSRIAVVFAEHALSGAGGKLEGGAMYGSAALAKVHAGGAAPELVGKRRFVTGPVARLATTMLSPTSFVVAYRQGEEAADGAKGEASCAFAQLHGSELVFDPHPLSLEPEQTQIWSRSVTLIGDNMVAYAYHSGNEQLTKQAVLRVDPKTHRVSLLRAPEVIGRGFTPYVGSLSMDALQSQAPRLVTYFTAAGSTKPQVRLCGVAGDGLPGGCQDLSWADREVTSVDGAPVGDGRLLFAFTDARGTAYYALLGLLDPF